MGLAYAYARAIETKDPSVIEDRWPGHRYAPRVLQARGESGRAERRNRRKRRRRERCGGGGRTGGVERTRMRPVNRIVIQRIHATERGRPCFICVHACACIPRDARDNAPGWNRVEENLVFLSFSADREPACTPCFQGVREPEPIPGSQRIICQMKGFVFGKVIGESG